MTPDGLIEFKNGNRNEMNKRRFLSGVLRYLKRGPCDPSGGISPQYTSMPSEPAEPHQYYCGNMDYSFPELFHDPEETYYSKLKDDFRITISGNGKNDKRVPS